MKHQTDDWIIRANKETPDDNAFSNMKTSELSGKNYLPGIQDFFNPSWYQSGYFHGGNSVGNKWNIFRPDTPTLLSPKLKFPTIAWKDIFEHHLSNSIEGINLIDYTQELKPVRNPLYVWGSTDPIQRIEFTIEKTIHDRH